MSLNKFYYQDIGNCYSLETILDIDKLFYELDCELQNKIWNDVFLESYHELEELNRELRNEFERIKLRIR